MIKRLLVILALSTVLASCTSDDVADMSTYGDRERTVADTSKYDYYSDDQLVTEGFVQIKERHFGNAYSIFKRAIEVMPSDPHAWLGYAAAADHLRRFDNADFAYRKLQPMIGNRPIYYNNVGYSYLLRGDLRQARRFFLKAYELDPSNATTANNIELLRNAVYHPKRRAADVKGL